MAEKQIPKYVGPDSIGRRSLMSKAEIKQRFDNETASLYSRKDPSWLPEFRYAFGLISRLVLPYIGSNKRALDIGAGTGNLSRTILESSKDAHVTLMDFSQNMLDEAPRVLERFSGRYDIINADFMTQPLGSEMYSVVMSSFAIHHCRSNDEYEALYKKIFGCLIQPGIFICCDVVAGDDAFLSTLNEKGWASFLGVQGFSDTEIEKILSNYHTEDSPASLRTHLQLLIEAGFDRADVIWKKTNFALYVGIKQQFSI